MNKFIDTVVAGCLHLGSALSQSELFLETLQGFQFRRLILNGDILEADRIPKKKALPFPHQLRVVEYLAELRNDGVEIVRIRGNHDWKKRDFINQLLGIKSVSEYRWEMNGRKFCAKHGHQYDKFISKKIPSWMNKVITAAFLSSQYVLGYTIARMIDRWHGDWCRLKEEVKEGAFKYAHKKRFDVIICGHTHRLDNDSSCFGDHVVHYWNCGDWTGDVCSLLTINREGNVEGLRINSYEPPLLKLHAQ